MATTLLRDRSSADLPGSEWARSNCEADCQELRFQHIGLTNMGLMLMLPDSTTFGFIIVLMIAFFMLGAMFGSFIGQTRAYERGLKMGKSIEKVRSGTR
jgi:hypothetical protein